MFFIILSSIITILSFLFLITYTLNKPTCKCTACLPYVSKSWRKTFTNLVDFVTDQLQRSATGTVHLHVLGNVITSNPLNVEHMLKNNFLNYQKGKQSFTILGDLLGKGIFVADGQQWKFQRKMSSLEVGSLAIRLHAMDLVSEEIRSRLMPLLASVDQNKQVIDMQDIFRRYSFDVICQFSFGLDPRCLIPSLPTSVLADAFDLCTKVTAERALVVSPLYWRLKRLLNIGSERKLKEALSVVNLSAEAMIKERHRLGVGSRKDLLSRFIESEDVDDKYLRDIVINFMLAGRDTIASALTGFFLLLSNNPHVEEKIQVELDSIMKPTQDTPTFEQTRELHYVNSAIHESMRLLPPVQFDSKFAAQDDVLPDGTVIRKGTRVTFHPYAMGRSHSIWGSDWMEFKPERWIKDGVFQPKSPYCYTVFQAGPRICIGKELALVEMRTVVASIVKQFNVRVHGPHYEPRFVPGLTAAFAGGLPVKICKRN